MCIHNVLCCPEQILPQENQAPGSIICRYSIVSNVTLLQRKQHLRCLSNISVVDIHISVLGLMSTDALYKMTHYLQRFWIFYPSHKMFRWWKRSLCYSVLKPLNGPWVLFHIFSEKAQHAVGAACRLYHPETVWILWSRVKFMLCFCPMKYDDNLTGSKEAHKDISVILLFVKSY